MNARADTIAAVATAPGAGGIGVVRVSGPGVAQIARGILGRSPPPRRADFVAFRDGGGAIIDRGLALWFPAPRSFTGEDVLELQAHGSPAVLRLLLARCVELGARHARPGEFSERAFLNGKLDLAQAEAVADLVASGSEAAARAAQRSLEGVFSAQVHDLVAATVHLRSQVEAAIDFPDEDIDLLAAPESAQAIADLIARLDDLLAGARLGVRLAQGLHVVIVGRPNVGKSSLLNALARSDRAIVTEVAGTTRDLVRETIDLDGIALTLVDTAGLREAPDTVEQEGIRRARAELGRADLALLVLERGEETDEHDLLASLPPGPATIRIVNKIDLRADEPRMERDARGTRVWLSARTGAGLEHLVACLQQAAGRDEAYEGAFSARTRHVAALESARARLASAQAAMRDGSAELVAEELRLVQRHLGSITGEFTSDNLLGAIFSSFCIGK
jgi:tRNA modification GTPase